MGTLHISLQDAGHLVVLVSSMSPEWMVFSIFGITFIDKMRLPTHTKWVMPCYPVSVFKVKHKLGTAAHVLWKLVMLMVPFPSSRCVSHLLFPRLMKRKPSKQCLIENRSRRRIWIRERDLKRAKAQEAEAKSKEGQEKKDAKDEKMEALLRKVDADFLAMIKEAEDDESKAAEASPLDVGMGD